MCKDCLSKHQFIFVWFKITQNCHCMKVFFKFYELFFFHFLLNFFDFADYCFSLLNFIINWFPEMVNHPWILNVHLKFFKFTVLTWCGFGINRWNHGHLHIFLFVSILRLHLVDLFDLIILWFVKPRNEYLKPNWLANHRDHFVNNPNSQNCTLVFYHHAFKDITNEV